MPSDPEEAPSGILAHRRHRRLWELALPEQQLER